MSQWPHNQEEVLTSLSGNRVARLVPSAEGTQLFINREAYSLQEACWDIEMFNGRNSSILIFYWKGEVKLSVKIAPLSNLLFLQNKSPSSQEVASTARSVPWSQVETFLMKLYQCLNFKSRTVKSF
ncbi:hypothetical protein D3C73_815270 [compost metagenome]